MLKPATAGLPGALVVENGGLRHSREGERHDEALRRLRRHDQRLKTVLDEAAYQLHRLVDGDATGDADQHGAVGGN